MTIYAAAGCDCRIDVGFGGKRPVRCPHGNRFLTEHQLGRNVGSGTTAKTGDGPRPHGVTSSTRRAMKRSEPKQDWTLALAKTQEENEMCRVCAALGVECAHILGRKYDQPISPGAKTLLVLPDRIVPLCGRHGHDCHGRYDAHELDLLPYLTAAEQAQAVLDAGSIGLALSRISGPDQVLAWLQGLNNTPKGTITSDRDQAPPQRQSPLHGRERAGCSGRSG